MFKNISFIVEPKIIYLIIYLCEKKTFIFIINYFQKSKNSKIKNLVVSRNCTFKEMLRRYINFSRFDIKPWTT